MSKDRLLAALRRAMEKARLDFDEVVRQAKAGEVQFHEVMGGCAVTTIKDSGPFRTCYILFVAGDRSAMAALDEVVTTYAAALGCQAIEANARTGWGKIDPPAPGYKPIAIVYRKTLE